MNAVATYAARVVAAEAQIAGVHARIVERTDRATPADPWAVSARLAGTASLDARQGEAAVLASYLGPTDILVDVGGGSGRLGLALAGHCREVINVDPSPEMIATFAELAAGNGITNARALRQPWLEAAGVHGDVLIAAHVTYFVRDIVPFVHHLNASARSRVMILLYATMPAGRALHQAIFRLLWGEEAEIGPSYRELLPVLWDIGIVPDVRLFGERRTHRVASSREEAIGRSLAQFSAIVGLDLERDAAAGAVLLSHFDDLFHPVEGGFKPLTHPAEDDRRLLITWEPHP